MHNDTATDLPLMHRAPVGDALHYGTRTGCTIGACVRVVEIERSIAEFNALDDQARFGTVLPATAERLAAVARADLADTVQGAAGRSLADADVDAIVAITRDAAEQTPVVKIARVLDPARSFPTDAAMAQAGHVWGATREHLASIARPVVTAVAGTDLTAVDWTLDTIEPGDYGDLEQLADFDR